MRNRIEFVLVLIACLTPSWVLAQVPSNPAETMQRFFDQFSGNAEKFLPGMFGELSEEQRERIDRIQITEGEENQAGSQTMKRFLEHASKQKWKVISGGRDVAYLKHLVRSIQPFTSKPNRYSNVDVRIIVTEASDAYSIPGGHLLFTSGLLESAESEAALIGVVAHELSHLDRGHLLLPIKQSKITTTPTDFADMMLMMSLFARPFRPEQESEADRDAVRWMMQAGYEPIELSRLLSRWDVKQTEQTPWIKFVPGFVKSHPDPGRRANQVLETATGLRPQYPEATFIGRENLAKRTAKKGR